MNNAIMDIVKLVNKKEMTTVRHKVLHFLHCIFIKTKFTSVEMNYYLKDIYKLVFYYGKENINASVSILCGFIQFGKSGAGKIYKPMIDYFMIEAMNTLIHQCGWSIIKPFMNMLHHSIPNYQTETTFNYICTKIITQLNLDMLSMQSAQPILISELCNHVPRERSFSFGWYSYYLACELYGNKNYYKQKIKQTHIRNYLMNYRKIMNELRKHRVALTAHDTTTSKTKEVGRSADGLGVEMNYSRLHLELNKLHYQAIDDIIDSVLEPPTAAAEHLTAAAEHLNAVEHLTVGVEEPAATVEHLTAAAEHLTAAAEHLTASLELPAAAEALEPPAAAEAAEAAEAEAAADITETEEITLTAPIDFKENGTKNTWFSGWFSGWS